MILRLEIEKGHIYKTVRLTDVKEIEYIKCPVLMTSQPRQGALMGWPTRRKNS